VGEAGTEERAVVLAWAHQPDVVVVDVLMAGKGGIALIPDLLEVSPESRVLMLTSNAEPGTVEKALEWGATGYSLKRATDTDLIAAVQTVAAGSSYVHPDSVPLWRPVARRPLARSLRASSASSGSCALGHTNQEIAEELIISTRTTEMHRANMMRKLRFQTRAQLVNYALANGLIGLV